MLLLHWILRKSIESHVIDIDWLESLPGGGKQYYGSYTPYGISIVGGIYDHIISRKLHEKI